ncbi:hypothetical protein ACF06X_13900 [Streptomyces sp. NPDC015346]
MQVAPDPQGERHTGGREVGEGGPDLVEEAALARFVQRRFTVGY